MSAAAGFSTRQVHAGEVAASATPRALPIHLTAGFPFPDFATAEAHFSTGDGFGYTRIGNPTIDAVERKLADLDGGTQALLLASGQAAVSAAILSVAGAGDHVVASTHIYEGSRGLFTDLLTRLGIETTFISDIHDPQVWRAAIRDNTRALFAESISNAANLILDVPLVSAVGDEFGVPVIIDSTFSTPYLSQPLADGAALTVHSASKFLAGHGSVLGGVIVDGGRFDPVRDGARAPHLVGPGAHEGESYAARYGGSARIGFAREVISARLGATISPLNAFLIGQGTETLSVRLRAQCQSAAQVAGWLEEHPAVASVDYAGLASHPDHERATRVLPRGYGAVFTFTLRGGRAAAAAVIDRVSTITHMTHLGDVRTLLLHPASTSHVHSSPEERAAVGVHDGTLRISIGLEEVEDLIADLDQALAGLS